MYERRQGFCCFAFVSKKNAFTFWRNKTKWKRKEKKRIESLFFVTSDFMRVFFNSEPYSIHHNNIFMCSLFWSFHFVLFRKKSYLKFRQKKKNKKNMKRKNIAFSSNTKTTTQTQHNTTQHSTNNKVKNKIWIGYVSFCTKNCIKRLSKANWSETTRWMSNSSNKSNKEWTRPNIIFIYLFFNIYV